LGSCEALRLEGTFYIKVVFALFYLEEKTAGWTVGPRTPMAASYVTEQKYSRKIQYFNLNNSELKNTASICLMIHDSPKTFKIIFIAILNGTA
jgi:hypothetical protein